MIGSRSSPAHGFWRRSAALAMLAALAGGIAASVWLIRSQLASDGRQLLDEARALYVAKQYGRAERIALQAANRDPAMAEAMLLAARCAAAQGEERRAVEHLRAIESATPAVRLDALLLEAEWNRHRLFRLSDAEAAYRAVLKFDPDNTRANRGLAQLLGICARRYEAIPSVLRLIRRGEASDLLILLSKDGAVIQEPGLLQQAQRAAPDDPNPLVGLAWHAAEADRTDEAIRLLQEVTASAPEFLSAHVALGEQFVAAGRIEALVRWERQLPSQANGFPGTWIVRADMAERVDDPAGAIRCYLEASRLAPESQTANAHLVRMLTRMNEPDLAERFAQRVRVLDELRATQDRFVPSVDFVLQLVNKYEAAGRLWEAYGWCQLAAQGDRSDRVLARLEELRHKTQNLPLRLTADDANPALRVERTQFPLPDFRGLSAKEATGQTKPPARVSFRNDAPSSGLRFRYFNGASQPTRKSYEFTGGGIGVVDFDVDGYPDTYWTQGRPWHAAEADDEYGDALFRNRGAEQFTDVAHLAGIQEGGFGQGCAVGDYNCDGFADLYVANIGNNRLWQNNGDGTFTDVTGQAGFGGEEWTTSVLLADLNGDRLPDIYDVNYLTGDDVFERVCTYEGTPRLCLPFEFEGARDRLWINVGNGQFVERTDRALSVIPNGKGLGIAAWDADETGRLNVLVANDITPNFYFVNESNGTTVSLRERGVLAGLALNRDGKAEGCMGIALTDLDRNGSLDVHVTNFYHESNTLYLSRSAGLFEDETDALGLRVPTMDLLGFGTQFLDADLDGRPELFVANGHVDDLRTRGKPYRMPPQVFRWTGDRFREAQADELGAYFRSQWLGRAAAKIDWNRDGRVDLAVGHLYDESALLTNTSPNPGRYLALTLIGVESNRDALGTIVEAQIGDRKVITQLTAGGGYQAANQRRIVIGAGEAESVEELLVRWPSGRSQRFETVRLSQELLLREGRELLSGVAHQ